MLSTIRKKADVYLNGNTLNVELKESLTSEENKFLSEYVEERGLGLRIARSTSVMTEEDKRIMNEIKKAVERMNAIPESEKKPLSQEFQDRMQSSVGTGEPASEEQLKKWRKQWLKDEDE